MRRVEPVPLTAVGSPTATAASLVATTGGMATQAGASGAATGVGSAEVVEECRLAGADVIGAGIAFESVSPVEASVTFSVASVVGSGKGVDRGLGAASGVGLDAGSERALQTASDTAVIGVGAGETAGVFARECFGGIAGTAFVFTDGVVGAAGGCGLSGGVSALPVVASVSCRSLITSRSFPLFLSALPVLPAPESTSSWAKLSMLSKILSNSAPSSSSPTTASVVCPWGGA